MSEQPPTADEFATWLRPRDALDRLATAVGDEKSAAAGLVQRLEGGAIRSAAKSSSCQLDGRTAAPTSIVLIPSDHWHELTKAAREGEFWRTGDARFFFGRGVANIVGFRDRLRMSLSVIPAPTTVVIRYFGVRLEPAGVEAWLADLPAPRPKHKWTHPKPKPEPTTSAAPSAPPTPVPDAPEATSGPPVSPEHLQAWYEVYQRVYTGGQDTEDNALKSAIGMFPGKSVTRNRIRELRGPRKTGRKPREPRE